jgi:hypothetical protein
MLIGTATEWLASLVFQVNQFISFNGSGPLNGLM